MTSSVTGDGTTLMLLVFWFYFRYDLLVGVMMGVDTISVPDHVARTLLHKTKPCLLHRLLHVYCDVPFLSGDFIRPGVQLLQVCSC